MHAVTWRTVRCRPRFPAAFVAGQRRPLRNRPFHRTTRALKSDDASKDPQSVEANAQVADEPPKDENAVPNEDQKQHSPAPTVQVARGVEAVENNAEYLKEQIQAARRTIKKYSSQLNKVSGLNQASGMPPVHIPPWFFRLNVALHDEARPDSPPSGGKPDIEGSLCINGVSEEQEELLRLALPMPPRLWEALETTAKDRADQKETVTNAAAFYSGFLRFINKFYRDADGAKADKTSGPAKWKLKDDLGVHFSLYLEILTAVAGSLHAKHPDNASSFPAAKSNLVLHCPDDGGIPQLEELVKDVSAKLQADLVTLGPQDIAELVGDYVGEGSDLASQSLRYLGYHTHRSQFENSAAEEEEFEDAEEEEGEESQESTMPDPRVRGKGRQQTFIIQGFPARGSFSDLFKAMDGRRPNGQMAGDIIGTGIGMNRPSSPQWDDIKLDASLKALLDAPSIKRTRLQDRNSESATLGSEGQTAQPVGSTDPQAETLFLGQTKSFRLVLDKNLQNVPKIPGSGERKRTVVLVKDYKELMTTQHGGHIIDKLTDIVRKRREDGEEVMIVGITSSTELFPEVSRAGVRRMQAENESDYARTIVVPLGPVTIDSLASATDRRNEFFGEGLDLTKEESLRIRDINVRHIFDMIGQLDPDAVDPVYADETRRHGVYERSQDWYDKEGKAIELTGPHLNRRVLAFHEVHRLAQTILGLLRATTKTQHATRLVVQLAMLLLRLSDDVKLSWAMNERLLASARMSFKTMNAAPKYETQPTLDAVAKSADKTEKKLLSGIVDPKAIKTTFDDVHVPDETKDALKTLISLSMQRPDAFKYGVLANDKMPGLLLYGPPGTGKTLLAKAVAKESGATVLQISASEIYEMWVGESEKNVRAVFSLARKLSPCVVFIDEADSLFGTRAGGKHKAHQKDTLNQFLKEWDGMNDLSVFIMVATNRPFDMDDAVLRRLPRRVLVDLPTEKDRESILKIHLKGEQLDEGLDLTDIAKRTPFYSGSDLKNLCVAAALNCVKEENIAALEKNKAASSEATSSTAESSEASTVSEETSEDATSAPATSTEECPTQSVASEPAESGSSFKTTTSTSLYPERRTLKAHHFEKAFEEIGASISEDMSSLVAIRKFDDQFGDKRNKKKKKSSWGFQTNEWAAGEDSVRVRK